MQAEEKIRQAFISLIKKFTPVQAKTGKVTAVDDDKLVCDIMPDDGSPEVFDARLTAVIKTGSNSIYALPGVGSEVVYSILGNNKKIAVVTKVSTITEYFLKAGNITFKLDENGVEINGKDFGGLIKIEEIVKKLNRLEAAHDALVALYNAHVHPVVGAVPVVPGTPPVTTPSAAPAAPIAAPTMKIELENEKVKHG